MPARLAFSLVLLSLATLAGTAIVAEEPTTKAAPPDANAQAEASKLIKEVYGREVASAKTAEQKKALAEKIFQLAKENDKDRSSEFMLLRLSRDLATQAADCQTAFKAIDETDKAFQIDALELKSGVLRKCAAAAVTVDQHAALMEKAAETADEAVAKDNLPTAKSLIDLALGEARKAKDDEMVRRSLERKAEIEAIAQVFAAVKKAMATLEASPVDPEANLIVGKYNCFAKGDWQHGLPMLALGNDPTLKALGEEEIKGVASSEEQAKLGDSWWNAAEDRKGAEKKLMHARAGYWYQQALPGLTGLAKDKELSRLRKLQDDLPVYLVDLPEKNLHVFENIFFKNGDRINIDVNGVRSTKGFLMHPYSNGMSSVQYQLDRKYRWLIGTAAISTGSDMNGLDPATPLTFEVLGDGKSLWRSAPLGKRGDKADCRISVSQVQILELRVQCPGSNELAHPVWLDPPLERK